MKKPNYYVTNPEFLMLLESYKLNKDRATYNKLGVIFLAIARHLQYHPWFINYSQDRKNEMASDATFYMIKYIDTFDSSKSSNPFSFFTMTAWNAFRQYIIKTNKREDMFSNVEYIDFYDSGSDE